MHGFQDYVAFVSSQIPVPFCIWNLVQFKQSIFHSKNLLLEIEFENSIAQFLFITYYSSMGYINVIPHIYQITECYVTLNLRLHQIIYFPAYILLIFN